jgi:hypothetical protein
MTTIVFKSRRPRSPLLAAAREGRARAIAAKLARRDAAFQPVETLAQNADFRAKVEAILNRRAAAYAHPLAGR